MARAIILPNRIETFSGRRGKDSHGGRFLLNPRPGEFDGWFAGTHGAAFIRMGDDVSFGAHPNGSIDHDTIAKSFTLVGEEMFRGYARIGGGMQLEVWSEADDESTIDVQERIRIDAIVGTFLSDLCIRRFECPRELVVFSNEHGQPILETPIGIDDRIARAS